MPTIVELQGAIEKRKLWYRISKEDEVINERELAADTNALSDAKAARAEYARAQATGEPLPETCPSLDDIDLLDLAVARRIEARALIKEEIARDQEELAASERTLDCALHAVSKEMSVAELEADLMPAIEGLAPLFNRMMALHYVTNYEYPDPRRKQPPLRSSAADSFGPVAHFIEHLRKHNWAIWPFCMRPSWLPKNQGRTSGYEPIPGTWAAVEQLKQELAQ